uniref:Uncharacterized protein n=1 Tax=Lepeophtheirus salmonis TaxID=72036 RepID=A0A0K2V3N7_LEPSM
MRYFCHEGRLIWTFNWQSRNAGECSTRRIDSSRENLLN